MTRDEQDELREAVIDVLAGDPTVHISTVELGERFGLNGFTRQFLWRILDRLARQGYVERITLPDYSTRFWRWIPPPKES